MGPRKRSQRDLHGLEELVVKHARIEESGEVKIIEMEPDVTDRCVVKVQGYMCRVRGLLAKT